MLKWYQHSWLILQESNKICAILLQDLTKKKVFTTMQQDLTKKGLYYYAMEMF
jgi:hypothetical protein